MSYDNVCDHDHCKVVEAPVSRCELKWIIYLINFTPFVFRLGIKRPKTQKEAWYHIWHMLMKKHVINASEKSFQHITRYTENTVVIPLAASYCMHQMTSSWIVLWNSRAQNLTNKTLTIKVCNTLFRFKN